MKFNCQIIFFIKFYQNIRERIFLSLFLFFFPISFIHPQTTKKHFFVVDNRTYPIVITQLNGYEYFYFDVQNSKKYVQQQQKNNFDFTLGKYKFFFLPGSFFFSISISEHPGQILQLNRPVIELNQRLLIPFWSFLSCLNSTGYFDYFTHSNSYIYKTKSNEKPIAKEKPRENSLNKISDEKVANKIQRHKDNVVTNIKSFPKILLTERERFSLQKIPFEIPINENNNLDYKIPIKIDTVSIPPKYYVLPPELKNSPK